MPAGLRYVPATPEHSVPLVMVWNPDELSPAMKAFRDLMNEWLKSGQLWQKA